ncbi:hypothetical protein V8E52_011302, partial [Russula decolorans]
QVQQNRSVVQVHQSHAKSARSHNKTRWGQLNSVPTPPSPHTSRLSFLFSYFLSVVLGGPVAPLVILCIILHLACPSRADPNNSGKDSPKMCFSTAFHLATVLLTHLIVSAAPLKHTTDPGTMQVLDFTYVLENLETEFYKQGQSKFKLSDFSAAGFTSRD